MVNDTDRKCAKCNRSTAQNPNLKLFRFPKPGKFNIERSRRWAHYCYPDQDWQSLDFQMNLYTRHKMLCHYHFKESDFYDFTSKKLNRYAAPSDNSTSTDSATQTVQSADRYSAQSTSKGPAQTDKESTQEAEKDSAQTAAMVLDQKNAVDLSGDQQQQTAKNTTIVEESTGQPISVAPPKLKTREQRLYNKCRRNMRAICKLKKQIRNLKKDALLERLRSNDAVQELSEHLSSPFAVLLQGELFNIKRKPRGRRWNLNQKLIALQLYKRSPSCYRLLRRLFSLPSQSTLKNLLNQVPLKPGINVQVFDTIRSVTKRESPENNECVLMFDEMAIRKHLQYDKKTDLIMGYQDHGKQGRDAQIASYALVFMVAGVRKKYKQPVAYYLSGASVTADRLTVLIKEVLEQCFASGLNVAASVCDMATTNTKALSNLGATTDHPYFMYGGQEIAALYDPPHLLKCFRNLFQKYNIKCNLGPRIEGQNSSQINQEGIAKWDHIKQFFEIDTLNPNFVFAPALTADHLDPNSKQKMKVKLAAQVLSFTVSAGMYSRIAQGELPAEAITTCNLIKKIDQLFDSLNADSPDLRRGKEFATNLADHKKHLRFWNEEMIPLFEKMEFIGAKQRPPSQNGWIQTMKGIQRLWCNLKKKYPNTIKSLATRRLQQDPLENCFGCIRGFCGNNNNPNATQFVAALKSSIINNMHKMSSRTNCEDDNATLLSNMNSFLKRRDNATTGNLGDLINVPVNDDSTMIDENFPEDSLMSEMQACAYVSGFVVRRILKDINCETCTNNLVSKKITPYHTFITFKEYNEKSQKLIYPTEKLTECIEELAKVTNAFLTENGHHNNLKENICRILKDREELKILNCVEHQEKIKESIAVSVFYICIKRFCIISNRSFSKESTKEQLKKKIKILKHN